MIDFMDFDLLADSCIETPAMIADSYWISSYEKEATMD